MKYIVALISLTISNLVISQPSAEIVETVDGPIKIYPVLHAAMAIEYQNKMVYLDPYGGAAGFAGFKKPDLILITDIHGDHLDLDTLEELNAEHSQIVAPLAVKENLGESYSRVSVLSNGESINVDGISITAVPMYNLPESSKSRHPKGRGNGYLIHLGGKTIYISGDTEDIPEMRTLEDIDIAFVCMNLPYTMTVDAAASAVLEFEPRIVFPFHYRGKDGLADIEKFKQLIHQSNRNIEVRLANWYPEHSSNN